MPLTLVSRELGDESGGAHPGERADAVQGAVEVGAPLRGRRIARLRELQIDRHGALGAETLVHLFEPHQAADEKAGEDEQENGEGDLAAHQQLAEP
jgi:hypothetical protein